MEPKNVPENKEQVVVTKFINKHTQQINNIKNLCGSYPSPEDAYFLWTLKSFNAFTFIPYIIKHCSRITELSFSTYSINARIVSALIRWYDKGDIEKINICIADSIKYRMPKVIDQLESQITNRSINLNYCWNHSKIQLIEAGGNFFVVEGSGNFSENAAHEQYLFLNDKTIYKFRYDCINRS